MLTTCIDAQRECLKQATDEATGRTRDKPAAALLHMLPSRGAFLQILGGTSLHHLHFDFARVSSRVASPLPLKSPASSSSAPKKPEILVMNPFFAKLGLSLNNVFKKPPVFSENSE